MNKQRTRVSKRLYLWIKQNYSHPSLIILHQFMQRASHFCSYRIKKKRMKNMSSGKCRQFSFKLNRRSPFYIQLIIVLLICSYLFDKFVIEKLHTRRTIVVQTDLLNYNEDNLRKEWQFQMDKHYDMHDLQTYVQKPKILAKFDLPGERGDEHFLSISLFFIFHLHSINVNSFHQWHFHS